MSESIKMRYAGAPSRTMAGSSLFKIAADRFDATPPVTEPMMLAQPVNTVRLTTMSQPAVLEAYWRDRE
jgi:hypothetical protein